MKIVRFDALDSTNDYAKAYEGEGGLIVVAKRQTAGRGTKGRTFDSQSGGIYLSFLRRYNSFPASKVFTVMVNSSLAVCKTLEEVGLKPAIKWPNDVFVNGKKICGILIENTFSGSRLSRSVVGIGLNVHNPLGEELSSVATSVSAELKKETPIKEVERRLIDNLQKEYSLEEYKKYLLFLGEQVCLIEGEQRTFVTAKDVDGLGRLIVEEDGIERVVTAGEVSLRAKEKEERL